MCPSPCSPQWRRGGHGFRSGGHQLPPLAAAEASGLADAVLGHLRGRRDSGHHLPPCARSERCGTVLGENSLGSYVGICWDISPRTMVG